MLPLQITTRNIPISPALETHIRQKAEKLNRFYNRICSCRIVIEVPQNHKHQGKLFNIRIDITVPGKELVVTHKQDQDIYIAIRDAFDASIRQLENHSHKRHGNVKTHSDIMHGHVVRKVAKEGYGFIEGVDGNEYYFGMTNVSYPSFEQLCIGDAVEYIAGAASDEGRKAQHILKERHNNHIAA